MVELDDIVLVNENNIKQGINNKILLEKSLKSSEKIDEVLHVITCISNVCEYRRRWELMIEFMERMKYVNNIKLYVVEMAYGDQEYVITEKDNPNHLQLRAEHALWHKENMINLGIKKLLPKDWKAVAWIDGDIEMEDNEWVINALKVLKNFDIIQLFGICLDLDERENPMNIWQSFGYKYCNGKKFSHERGLNYWHCGYAWACTRDFYEKMNGLYDRGILGSGDYILSQIFLGNIASLNNNLTEFKNDIINHYKGILGEKVKVGYIPSIIKHYFHGSKKNRKYIERNNILKEICYDPCVHVKYDQNGVLVNTDKMYEECIKKIKDYFYERNEDEYYEIINKEINKEYYSL
jgi:hypothetical protein